MPFVRREGGRGQVAPDDADRQFRPFENRVFGIKKKLQTISQSRDSRYGSQRGRQRSV